MEKKFSFLVHSDRNVVLMEKSVSPDQHNPIATLRSISQAKRLVKVLNEAK